MKECKNSGILPCYRDGYGVWHHSDDTHDKVYELNKQMCDIERGLNNDFLDMQVRIADKLAKDVVEGVRTPDWAKNMLAGIPEQLSRAEYEILDEILKEKNRLMEKKTKKMTKAEAFEYLKGKKVKCYKVGEHYGEELLKKLTECGCTSNIFLPKGILSVWAIFISDVCDLSILDTAHADQYGNYDLCEISADDILSIEIVEEKKKSKNVNIELEKWIGVIRDKFCCNGWSFVISASNFALFSGDLIEEKRIKE